MTPERWKQIDRLAQEAFSLEPRERASFLDGACAGDGDLRREVESLIAYQEKAADLMEMPALEAAAASLANSKGESVMGETFGRYKVLGILGEGGMGTVYLAQDTSLGRKVALKLLPGYFTEDKDRVRRFEQEARAASALNHPNILTIYEVGRTDGRYFIATEFIDGVTLRERMAGGAMELSEVLETATQVASALAAAHEAGIVHRDIKPENIMLRRRDRYVKVLDFGLAKLTENAGSPEAPASEMPTRAMEVTGPGVVMGTVAYMSPEQARGLAVDARTDIWSLGCVLYEMLAGRAPFKGGTATDTLVAILEKEPPPLENLAAGPVPAELNSVVNKTLRKDKGERYQTSEELLTDLRNLKERLEFEARFGRAAPPGLKGKTAKAAPRRMLEGKARGRGFKLSRRAAALAALLLVTVAGALTYVWRWRQTPAPPQPEIRTLAVLPLRSLDAGENYLGLGIADAVIRRISQTGGLIVRPTSAVRRYLNEEADAISAARQLQTDAVLEGSVQRADDRLRVSVNLLRTGDGASLWADNFDMRMTDIFTIQDTVAQQVAARLLLRLDPEQQARLTKRSTSNPVAYEYYVKGVYSFDQRGWDNTAKPQAEATIDLFKKAIVADPNFALAHAQLAYVYAWLAIFIEPTEQPVWAGRAKEEISRAETLDPQLAETHLVRHLLLFSAYEGWQNEAAVRELLVAQQLSPNIGHAELGSVYTHIGLEDLAARELQRALDIDPTSEYVKGEIYGTYYITNKYDEALAADQKFFGGKPNAWYFLGKGRLDEAQKIIEETLAKEPDNPLAHRRKALLLALRGDFRAAEAEIPLMLNNQSRNDRSYHHIIYDIACVYALAGKTDEAVKRLREIAATGFPCYTLFERDPYLNRVRQAPEFVQFMAEMKAQYERYRREFG